ncbi:MAG: hypothetical protein ACLR0U_20175 [Enterocloster clostridioformis]
MSEYPDTLPISRQSWGGRCSRDSPFPIRARAVLWTAAANQNTWGANVPVIPLPNPGEGGPGVQRRQSE